MDFCVSLTFKAGLLKTCKPTLNFKRKEKKKAKRKEEERKENFKW
jgi:hypothetical protein